MKIVHILPAMTKGGGERVAVDLANHAAGSGHQVSVVAGFAVDPTLLQNHLRAEIDVRFVTAAPRSRVQAYMAVFPWLLRNWRWVSGQDIIHCHMTMGAVIGALIQGWRTVSRGHMPTVVETYHAVGMPIPGINRRVHAAMAARRDALALIAVDDYWRAFLNKHPALISAIIPNGVAIPARPPGEPELRAYRRRIGIPGTYSQIIGTVGRLQSARRPWLYVPIFARIAEAMGPDVHFILGGEGAERDRIRMLVAEHGLEGRVHLPGMVRDPALAQAAMDLYLTLNVGPVTGVAALEAAGLGTPVLAIQLLESYRATPSDMIWSSTDIGQVAERAIALLRSSSDRRAMANKQCNYVKTQRSVEVMAQSYEGLYRAALEKVRERESDRWAQQLKG